MNTQDNLTKRSLRFSLFDGIFSGAMVGFTQDYFTPFLLTIGAGVRQIGFLNALPNLAASLAQVKSADMVERLKSRRHIINIFVLLQALVLVPMAVVAFSGKSLIGLFIALVVIFTTFGAMAMPPWSSLMSDLVKEGQRGAYFGWRIRTIGFVIVGMMFAAGFILQQMKALNIYHGFAILFACAFVFRLVSWYFVRRMHEPRLEHRREDRFTLFDFLLRARESNFVRFTIFIAMMNFSVTLVAPFFPVLMLKHLHFSYLLYSCVTLTATLTIYLIIGRWGNLADRVGNLRVIKFVAPIISIIPLLWVINRSPFYLFVVQVVSGFAWAGFNLCSSNFIFDAVQPAKRTRCIAYFNVLTGLALFAGPILGGFLIHCLPPLYGSGILTVCVLSFILRAVTALSVSLALKEVRTVESLSNIDLFTGALGIRSLARIGNNG